MKIGKIIIQDNPILGEFFEIDLCNSTGIPYDTILLVGENGSGKSTLLNIIYVFSRLDSNSGEFPNQKWTFEIFLSNDDIALINRDGAPPMQIPLGSKVNIVFDFTAQVGFRLNVLFLPSSIVSNLHVGNVGIKVLKSIFSDVSINFTSKNINNVTDTDIDRAIEGSIKSDEDISTQITQMLVDIYNRDAGNLNSWVKANTGIAPPDQQIEIRTKRFKNAFIKMFADKLEYIGAEGLKPTFKKGTQFININKLSSGEKQIVFRGSYLLKDQESIKGALVLIDEPEISLHPVWQQKILSYYKALFADTSGVQTSQIFITTHSPYLLQDFNGKTDGLFIFPGGSKLDTLPKYLGNKPSLGVVNYYAYNLPTVEFHDELYGYIQTKAINIDPSNSYEDSFELFLERGGLMKNKKWTREKEGIIHPMSKYHNYDVTLQAFIRNKIHHPENITMSSTDYTRIELKESIDGMIKFIQDNGLT